MSTKLLLPAAGRAVRLGGVAKELLPLGIRVSDTGIVLPNPVIAWSLWAGLCASVDSAVIVISADKATVMMEAVSSLKLPLPISYVHQGGHSGLAEAILCAEPHITDEDIVLLLLADGVMWPPDVLKPAVYELRNSLLACVAVHQVEHPERFGIAVLDDNGCLVEFEEKPAFARSNWAWTAISFRKGFFAYLKQGRSQPGDAVTNAMNSAIREGVLNITKCAGRYWDVGTYDSYVSALTTVANIDLAKASLSRGGRPRERASDGLGKLHAL